MEEGVVVVVVVIEEGVLLLSMCTVVLEPVSLALVEEGVVTPTCASSVCTVVVLSVAVVL